MGTYLSTPVLDKSTMSGDDLEDPISPLSWACVDMQGWRKSMEDAHVARTDVPVPPMMMSGSGSGRGGRGRPPPDPDGDGGGGGGDPDDPRHGQQMRAKVFAVFDGHGGPEVARFCERHIVDVITSREAWAGASASDTSPGDVGDDGGDSTRDVGRALVESFHAMDRLIDDPDRRGELAELRALAQWHVTKPYDSGRGGGGGGRGGGDHHTEDDEDGDEGDGGTTGISAIYGADLGDDDDEGEDADAEVEAEAEADRDAEDDDDEEDLESEVSSGCSTESLMGSDTDLDSLSSASSLPGEDDDDEDDDEEDEEEGAAITTVDAMALFQKLLKMSNEKARDAESPAGPALTGDDVVVDDGAGEMVVALEKTEEESSSVTVTLTKNNPNAAADDDGGGGGRKVVSVVTKEKEESTTATATIEVDGATAEISSTSSKAVVVSDEQQGGVGGVGAGDEKKQAEGDRLLGDDGSNDSSSSPAEASAPPLELAPAAAATDSTIVKTVTTTTTTTQSSSVTFAASRTYPNGRKVCTLADHPIQAGCTSIVAVLIGRTLTVANAGDSRAVLCRGGGVAHPLSHDHKPLQDVEMDRITKAGGFVNQFGRVNGNLNLSRSIGDLKYKQTPGLEPSEQMITAEPDVVEVELLDDDEFVVIGCDGIWDCLTNEEAVRYVRERIDVVRPADIVAEMLDDIVSDDPRTTQGIGGDNMTCMIVDLLPHSRTYRGGRGCSTRPQDGVVAGTEEQGKVSGERAEDGQPRPLPRDQKCQQQRTVGGGSDGGDDSVGGCVGGDGASAPTAGGDDDSSSPSDGGS